MTKYLVSDNGITEIDERHDSFNDEEAPVFNSFNEALLVAIQYLSMRVKDLEEQISQKE